jgi:hypothetical protein
MDERDIIVMNNQSFIENLYIYIKIIINSQLCGTFLGISDMALTSLSFLAHSTCFPVH